MKRVLFKMMLWLCLAGITAANDFTYLESFLWNDIRAVVQQGDYLYGAFHDGVAVIDLADAQSKKVIRSKLEVEGIPYRLNVFGNLLAVQKENGIIDLIDLSFPDNLQVIGSLDSPEELFDLEVAGDFLYFALGYAGLIRYNISDPGNILFDDSSLAGINITALQYRSPYLYVLDDYNGVLVYEPGPEDIGSPVSELLLPRRAISMTIGNDSVYAGFRPTGFMVGYVGDISNPVFIESRTSFIRADNISALTDGLVLYNSHNGFELIHNDLSGQADYLFPLNTVRGYGTVFNYGGYSYLVMPDRNRGLVGFGLDNPDRIDPDRPDFEYRYPGPVNQMEFINGFLHVIGPGNPYEIYDIDLSGAIISAEAFINPLYQPVGIGIKDDTIYIADAKINAIFTAVAGDNGGLIILPDFFALIDPVGRPNIIREYFVGVDLIYYHNESIFNGSFLSGGEVEPNLMRYNFTEGVRAAWPARSILYQADYNDQLHVYNIDRFYEIEEKAIKSLPGAVNVMVLRDTLLYLGGDDLMTLSVSDPFNTVIVNTVTEPENIRELDLEQNELVCAAGNGIFVYDISTGLPSPLLQGGNAAISITRRGDLLALTDGHSVKLYNTVQTHTIDDLTVPDYSTVRIKGYPNPFNLSISIELINFREDFGGIEVSIFDILGRKINSLVVKSSLNENRVTWDGTDFRGRPAASGVYFIKAANSIEQASLKVVLIK